jgi:IS1 family transposase
MAQSLEPNIYSVEIMCSDGYRGYGYWRLAKRYVVSKAETSLVKSKNSLITHYLARLNKKYQSL